MSKNALQGVVLSILVAVIAYVFFAPLYFGHVDTKLERARSDIEIISRALDLYKQKHEIYPSTAQGLHVLNESNKQAYLDRIPKDPWGGEYNYRHPGTHNLGSYDLWAEGPNTKDGGSVNDQRIGNWAQ